MDGRAIARILFAGAAAAGTFAYVRYRREMAGILRDIAANSRLAETKAGIKKLMDAFFSALAGRIGATKKGEGNE